MKKSVLKKIFRILPFGIIPTFLTTISCNQSEENQVKNNETSNNNQVDKPIIDDKESIKPEASKPIVEETKYENIFKLSYEDENKDIGYKFDLLLTKAKNPTKLIIQKYKKGQFFSIAGTGNFFQDNSDFKSNKLLVIKDNKVEFDEVQSTIPDSKNKYEATFDQSTRILTIKYLVNSMEVEYIQEIQIPKSLHSDKNTETNDPKTDTENPSTNDDNNQTEGSKAQDNNVKPSDSNTQENPKNDSQNQPEKPAEPDNSNNNNGSDETPKPTTEDNLGLNNEDYFVFGSWNILNFGKDSLKENSVKVTGLSEIIATSKASLISLQEVNFNKHESVDLIKNSLRNNFNKNFASVWSPKNIVSTKYPNSKESYAILYDPELLTNVPLSNEESIFRGTNTTFTRPLWLSKFIDKKNNEFYILNAHLDSPGAKKSNGETSNPTINGYTWRQQGSQEVNEFIEVISIINNLKAKYPNATIIFNGDTNIKSSNFVHSEKIIADSNLESGYKEKQLTIKQIETYYNSSIGSKADSYSQPYDKFIIYDPNDKVDAFDKEKFRFDYIKAFQKIFDQQKYLNLVEEDNKYQRKQKPVSIQTVLKEVSDHTMVLIKVKK
ncbi:MnuA family membrane nuclease [Mycoplasmopsis edwardii]|uniref:Uncharacterized protein n=1 Tax=Mycoplasmopsis edwardii TaxID=53558 RepID=A0ACD4PIE1_9BACT|nr:hypothetical protein [Mycoplasmopsis edwardii]WBP83748.1 hypothetical protein Me_995_000367 [Mycoplasmopsis edwardii]